MVIVAVLAKPLAGFFNSSVVTVLVGIGALSVPLMAYVLLGPYQQVRTLNLCLPNTDFPGVRFVSTLSARAYSRLQLKNLVLTLLSLGLYRPFAVVSAHRYRLAHIMLEVDEGFDHVLADVKPTSGAAGDGTADFLGVDLSW
jgi:uncharacterized membrane protein YjgN (DUF898 family)